MSVPSTRAEDIVGMWTDFSSEPPFSMFVRRHERMNYEPALTLTTDLIDDVLSTISPSDIDAAVLDSLSLGDNPNLAERTLEIVRDRLHALVDDPEASPPE